MERSLSRLSVGRGGPRDLGAIGDGLARTALIKATLEASAGMPQSIAAENRLLEPHREIRDLLESALADDIPLQLRDGGFIRAGYFPALDELRALRDESRRLIAALQARYQADTGIPALKIRHNNVLGYFVEVPAKQGDRMMADETATFIHRQTMANAVRFTTTELNDLESSISKAADDLAHAAGQSAREQKVRSKFNTVEGVLKDCVVVMVDDSIVRGTTAKQLVQMVRKAGAKEVHFRSASPPVISPCFYGMDFPSHAELFYNQFKGDLKKMEEWLGVDSLAYLSQEGLHRAVKAANENSHGYCDACFSNNYPVPVDMAVSKDENEW